MNLIFQNDKLISIKQSPVEKERLRLDVYSDNKNKDPLTSFLEIIMGETKSLVIDGRRVYKMGTVLGNKPNQIIIEISNYFNLWADHKRNKFEKIIFSKNNFLKFISFVICP